MDTPPRPAPLSSPTVQAIAQVSGPDPTIYDLDAAIASWTTLFNFTLPSLFATLESEIGVLNTL